MTSFKIIGTIFIIFLFTFSWSYAGEIETIPEEGNIVEPNVVFVISGDSIDDSYTHYRVILNVMEIYSVVIIQKVMPENEEQAPKIFWSRCLDKGFGNRFIFPKDFVRTFKWESIDSFSFENNRKKYIVTNIGEIKPIIKEIK